MGRVHFVAGRQFYQVAVGSAEPHCAVLRAAQNGMRGIANLGWAVRFLRVPKNNLGMHSRLLNQPQGASPGSYA
jgi:hypothetical protein